MPINNISTSTYRFLEKLKNNNNREWFEENKKEFKKEEALVKKIFIELQNEMNKHDEIDKMKMFRIYRDIRFSKDKTPYKTHFSASFHRFKPKLRGGYYVHIEPENTFLACGFWDPDKGDLLRIRKELETDAAEMRKIIENREFKKTFGDIAGDELKSAPKGFDKNHPDIDLIKKKQYVFIKKFSEKEATSPDFLKIVNESFKVVRPWFNYMSEVLTTDLNGVSMV
ncbi:DUF2461 domain-containing protein [Abyssalbus ytuae]|uniref:DUF2461 domain-containing protein n=1 Tax=Abyssalbus ytuae TaxID=2926907 RepID=A0A9E6ZVM5_9FLAO|nr:DUF2461 domain-containing protein [Abyssalbus ytuae]UOB17626.1 DUF2461 domain-containing protein [Abyssalbus ytuae]